MKELSGIVRVICDSDLDGLVAGAILKRVKPELEIIFSHAAQIRSGFVDHLIDYSSALCDLPFHPRCGLYLDHHVTNRPTKTEEDDFVNAGGFFHWRPTPSAARAAFELCKPYSDLTYLETMMPIVDALDSGGITKNDFLQDGFLLRLARTLSPVNETHMQKVCQAISEGNGLEKLQILFRDEVEEVSATRALEIEQIIGKTTVIDRLAICRLENTGLRSSGYLITAIVGDSADACCIIHGNEGGSINSAHNPALSASFYANSFLSNSNFFNLSRLATLLDKTGGGHHNACGCRIQAIGPNGSVINRKVVASDIDLNLEQWLAVWKKRDEILTQ